MQLKFRYNFYWTKNWWGSDIGMIPLMHIDISYKVFTQMKWEEYHVGKNILFSYKALC